jgi:cytochrome c5
MYVRLEVITFIGLGILCTTLACATPDAPITPTPAQSINEVPDASQTNKSTASDTPALPRGQLLYENHCRKCHESQVHIRENHKARSLADVQGWVYRWQTEEKLGWSTDEINDVSRYLAARFYKFKP